MHEQERELLKLMPNAVSADDWDKLGNDFNQSCQVNMTSAGQVADSDGWQITLNVLKKYGAQAIAYSYVQLFGPNSFSLEVKFDDVVTDNAVRLMWTALINAADKAATGIRLTR